MTSAFTRRSTLDRRPWSKLAAIFCFLRKVKLVKTALWYLRTPVKKKRYLNFGPKTVSNLKPGYPLAENHENLKSTRTSKNIFFCLNWLTCFTIFSNHMRRAFSWEFQKSVVYTLISPKLRGGTFPRIKYVGHTSLFFCYEEFLELRSTLSKNFSLVPVKAKKEVNFPSFMLGENQGSKLSEVHFSPGISPTL